MQQAKERNHADINIDYEVLPDRLVTIKLPEEICPGRHELVSVVEEQPLLRCNKFANRNRKTIGAF